jgi:hypothetical protein
MQCPLNTDRPPHAYPTTYPPTCGYDPFPIFPRSKIFATPWLRHTSRKLCSDNTTPLDLDELCSSLSRMTLAEEKASEPKRSLGLSTKMAPSHISRHDEEPIQTSLQRAVDVAKQMQLYIYNHENNKNTHPYLCAIPSRSKTRSSRVTSASSWSSLSSDDSSSSASSSPPLTPRLSSELSHHIQVSTADSVSGHEGLDDKSPSLNPILLGPCALEPLIGI